MTARNDFWRSTDPSKKGRNLDASGVPVVRKNRPRLLLTAVVAIACCLTVMVPSPPPVRVPAAIALLFVLPGYALLHASRLDRSRDPLERVVVIVGAGTALVVVLSIAIGASPLGLSGGTFAVTLTALVLADLVWAGLRVPTKSHFVAIGGLVRRSRAGRDALEQDPPAAPPHRARSIWPNLAWLAAVALTVGSLSIAGTDAQLSQPPIIQLWMLPEPGGARVGIYNGTADTQRYRVVIGPRGVAAESMSIDVPLGSKLSWQETIAFPASWLTAAAVDANLYATDVATAPMRTVWVDPLAGRQ
jgi:hypothetical protein